MSDKTNQPPSPPLAPNALTTLADMKAMLGISPDDIDQQRDIIITNLINYVSAWIERKTGRNLGKQTYTQEYVASGAQELVLLQWPILSVEYVKDKSTGEIIPSHAYDFNVTGDIRRHSHIPRRQRHDNVGQRQRKRWGLDHSEYEEV